jgi:amidophosphoribosyltransferase
MSSRLFAELAGGGFAVAHNGNLTNAMTLKRESGEARLDLPVDLRHRDDHPPRRHLELPRPHRPLHRRAAQDRRRLFARRADRPKKMIGCRDPLGIRPLVLGKLDDAWILASETCALDIIGARFVRDLEPGEIVIVTSKGIESIFPFAAGSRFCIFEYVYFARPDSSVEGLSSMACARRSAPNWRAKPGRCRFVVPVPDSGVPGRDRLCAGRRHPVRARHHPLALCRPHLHPAGDSIRHMGVKLKHNANRALLEGKRIVLVDDSIVRGTTSLKIVQMMRDAGAPRCTCASPRRRPATAASMASTRPSAKLLAARMTVAGNGRVHRRRQPRLPLDRRPLSRRGRERARRRDAARILRCLLHRRLSDPADR